MSGSPSHSLKQAQAILTANRDKLSSLAIPKLKNALEKLEKLLVLAKKTKGNDEALQELVKHVTSLNQNILAPILEASATPEFSLSGGLQSSLPTLFSSLDAAITAESQLSSLSLLFSHADVAKAVLEVNSRIGPLLDQFLQQGILDRSGGRLIQTKPDLRGVPTSILSPTGGHVQAQVDPNSPTLLGGLPSQLQATREKCPRFRILLLGKSGAGKSSLINRVFGLPTAEIANYKSGRADIEKEHVSEHNDYIVLHDSMGFEPGSLEQYNIVQNFIEERSKKPALADKLHAIWLCIATPVSGGRVLEVGDEQIFKLNLGDVPLIVVFTQYDTLVSKARMEGNESGPNLEAIANTGAEAEFNKLCIRPLEEIYTEILKRETLPPFIKVSIQQAYKHTLLDLVRLTHERLPPDAKDQIPPDLGHRLEQGIALTIAQRVNPTDKINATIMIGRQRYWRGLASSFDFDRKTLEICIDVVHLDIVGVWNFNDLGEYLTSLAFKTLMFGIVTDLIDGTKYGQSASQLSKLAEHLSGVCGILTPPIEPIIAPLVLGKVAVKWVYDAYQRTPGVVRCLMGYIVDLTIVMHWLFCRMQVQEGAHPVAESLAKEVAEEYRESEVKKHIHDEIKKSVREMGIIKKVMKDTAVGKVEQLINVHLVQPNAPISQN